MSAAPGELWRAGGAEDVAAIRALVDAAYSNYIPLTGRRPPPMQADYARAIHRNAFTLVEKEGELIGLVETEARPDHLCLVNVAVAAAHQRRGLGRRLIAWAEAEARAKGYDRIDLMTHARSGANIALYQRLGYSLTRREPLPGGSVVYMTKPLSKTS